MKEYEDGYGSDANGRGRDAAHGPRPPQRSGPKTRSVASRGNWSRSRRRRRDVVCVGFFLDDYLVNCAGVRCLRNRYRVIDVGRWQMEFPRKPSPIDAAAISEFVDRVLADIGAGPGVIAAIAPTDVFRPQEAHLVGVLREKFARRFYDIDHAWAVEEITGAGTHGLESALRALTGAEMRSTTTGQQVAIAVAMAGLAIHAVEGESNADAS